MQPFDKHILEQLYIPAADSHKGQNGKLLIIGGSHLFHAASLWALTIASRIVDMVFYSSVPENNDIVLRAKDEFRNGIVIPRNDLESYIKEADCILIGSGMIRTEEKIQPTEQYALRSLSELDEIEHEGIQTYYLTKYMLETYPQKKFVLDAGALQMMEKSWLEPLAGNTILTPHKKEFATLFGMEETDAAIAAMAVEYNTVILTKGDVDIVCSTDSCVRIPGGNVGMTKGGTGDVLAGLVAALACKNDLFVAAVAGSYFNKKAGEKLAQTVGSYFNASDLAETIPQVMKEELSQ